MYQETVRQAQSLILIVDAHQRIAYLNPWGEQRLGIPPGGAFHLGMAKFFTSPGFSWPIPSSAGWEQMIARPGDHGPIVSRHRASDGSIIWLSWTASEWMDACGHLVGTIVLGTDVTHYHHDDVAGFQEAHDTARRLPTEGKES